MSGKPNDGPAFGDSFEQYEIDAQDPPPQSLVNVSSIVGGEGKFAGHWFYCDSCEEPIIICEDCGNSSCNGSSCEKCHADFEEATRMALSGEAPPREGLKVRSWKWAFDAMFDLMKLAPDLDKPVLSRVYDRVFGGEFTTRPTGEQLLKVIEEEKMNERPIQG